MLNAQVSIVNEWSKKQCSNALNHLNIEHLLSIEHCQLSIQSVVDLRKKAQAA